MTTVLLLGSGFSAGANKYAQDRDRGLKPSYPVIRDLAQLCFPDGYDLSSGIEQAFASALERRDRGPIDRLVEAIQAADHYVGSVAAADPESCFQRLLDQFPTGDILTFNYDCLAELLLLKRGAWTPGVGFGVAAEFEIGSARKLKPDLSPRRVLHLHGSFYLYATEFDFVPDKRTSMTWLEARSRPRYTFDPDALSNLFAPYERGTQGLGFRLPSERIIAPVPDKTEARIERYVREVYDEAKIALSRAELLIAIGYSFAQTDIASFAPLLASLPVGCRTMIVSPDASDIAGRLRSRCPACEFLELPVTLEQWAQSGFTGATAQPNRAWRVSASNSTAGR